MLNSVGQDRAVEGMLEQLVSVDFLKFFLPAAGAVVAWFIDRRQRRALEEYQRKEERYREMLNALPGFYVESQDEEQKQAFLNQINLCWLYCSDEVIRKAYGFIATVHTDEQRAANGTRQRALGELILAIREDLISRSPVKQTNLRAEEFRVLAVTKLP
jgi:hypothetical protein